MSALESLIGAGGEAPLMQSLSFDLPPGSTAVVDRKQGVRAYPTSASSLQIGGTRTCRIRLGGNDFVDPSTVRLQFVVTNTHASNSLAPACGPWGVWGQVRLLSGGVELDNLPYYSRFHQMHGWHLLTMEQQYAEAVFGWGGSVDETDNNSHPRMGFLAPGTAITVSHRLNLSLFTAGKALPLRYAPLELELTLSDASNWCLASAGGTNYSQSFTVSDIQLFYDSMVLDEAVQELFYKALLSNRVLNIPCQQFFQVVQSIPAGATTYSFSIVRAFSKLSHVWITFKTAAGLLATNFNVPTAPATALANSWVTPVMSDNAPSIRLSIGPKNWPDYQPVTTIQEHFWMLQTALPGVPMLDRKDFGTDKFISVFDLRRVPADATTALSTRSGDLLRIDLKNLTADLATEVHVTLWAFAVCSVRESGLTLLD